MPVCFINPVRSVIHKRFWFNQLIDSHQNRQMVKSSDENLFGRNDRIFCALSKIRISRLDSVYPFINIYDHNRD